MQMAEQKYGSSVLVTNLEIMAHEPFWVDAACVLDLKILGSFFFFLLIKLKMIKEGILKSKLEYIDK